VLRHRRTGRVRLVATSALFLYNAGPEGLPGELNRPPFLSCHPANSGVFCEPRR
jgi:hypothetical protein